MIKWVDRVLNEWGISTEKMLDRSSLGYKSETNEARLMETGGEVIRSTHKGDSCPRFTLPRYLMKMDRILRQQPPSFSS